MIALAVAGYATALGVFMAKDRLFILPFLVVSWLILTLHFAALLDFLYPAAIGLKYGGLLAFVAGAIMLIRRHPVDWPSRLLDAPKVFLLVVSAMGWLVVRGRGLTHWDEFSHWGFLPKYLYFSNHLPDQVGGPVIFLDYPPGASLFHYLGVVGGPFREDLLYHANHVLLLSPIASLLFLFTWRRPMMAVAMVSFFYFLYLSLGQGFKSLLVDQHMGVFFAVIISIYLIKGREDRFILAALSLPMAALMILKNSGGMLLGIAMFIIIADQAVSFWKNSRHGIATVNFGNTAICRGPVAITALCVSLLIAIPLATHFSWKAHVAKLNIPITLPLTKITPRAYFDALSGKGSQAQTTTVDRFIHTLSNSPFGGGDSGAGHSLPKWIFFATLLFVAATILAPSSGYRLSTVITGTALLVGLALYLAGLLALYLFSFPDIAGVNLYSLDRYATVYLLGIILVGFMALAGTGREWWGAALGVLATAFIATSLPSWGPLLKEDMRDYTGNSDRDLFARAVIPKDSSTLIACEVDCGLSHFITRYKLLPRYSDLRLFIPPDNSSPVTVQKELERFDYLYVYLAGERLNRSIAPIAYPASPYADPFLYRTRKDGQALRLEPVTTAPDSLEELAPGRSIIHAWKGKTGADAIHHDLRGVFPPWVPSAGSPSTAHLYEHLFPDTCLAATSGVRPVFALADGKLAHDLSLGITSRGALLATTMENAVTFLTPDIPSVGLAKLAPIFLDDAVASASTNNAMAFATIDGNAATLWSAPRKTGIKPVISIDLGKARQIAGVDLLSPDLSGAPEKLVIDLSEDGLVWRSAGVFPRNSGSVRWAGPRPLADPYSPLLSYRFESTTARFLRMKDEGESQDDWQLAHTWILEASQERADMRPPDFTELSGLVTRKDTPLIAGDAFFISSLAMHTGALAGSDALRFSSCYPRGSLAIYPVSNLATIASDDRHEAIVASYFREEGIIAETRRYNGYHIWISAHHPLETMRPLPPGSIRNIVTTHNSSFAMMAADGDMDSVWRSGEAQRRGMGMTIDLGGGRKVSGVSVDAGGDQFDLPRKAAVEVSMDGATWNVIPEARRVHRQMLIERGMPVGNDTALIYLFAPRNAKFIRMTLLEDRGTFNWSAREVTVYEPQ